MNTARTPSLVLLALWAVALPSPVHAQNVIPLIESGSFWRYNDTGTDLGTAWRAPEYDDSNWSNGQAQLGYGDGDETTVVSFGGNDSNKQPTTYFRTSFDLADPGAIQDMTLYLKRDDGAVVYLNGTEVFRNNMPGGTISYFTFASTFVAGDDENFFVEVELPSAGLVAGPNVVAVEIHQSDPGSSDISFDLELLANPAPTGPPVITTQPMSQTLVRGSTAVFTVVAVGSTPLRYQWEFNGAPMQDETNSTLRLTNVTPDDVGTYRVTVSNDLGMTPSVKANLNVIELPDDSFRILAITPDNSAVFDHNNLTSDDRGGIATSALRVFYTGDGTTAGFGLDNLQDTVQAPLRYDALVSDLKTERIYTLGNGNNPMNPQGTVTTLLQLDDDTGALTGTVITLSQSINLPNYGETGIFSGYGRILLHTGERVYRVELPTGQVQDLGPMNSPQHTYCENWAYWGVTEYFNDTFYLVHVRDYQTIVRTRVPDGESTVLASFQSLSDMCSISVSLVENRWYFHHEGGSQFGGTAETIGYADAEFEYPASNRMLEIRTQPVSRTVPAGWPAELRVRALGDGPISYQWYHDGQAVPGATSNVLTIQSLTAELTGTYYAEVRNPSTTLVSSNATLSVLNGEFISVFADPNYVGANYSSAILAELAALGHVAFPVTDLSLAANTSPVIIFPSFSVSPLFSDLAEATRNLLVSFVENGGTMIVHGTAYYLDSPTALLNGLFGYQLTWEYGQNGDVYARTTEVAGTTFSNGPASLDFYYYTLGLNLFSLPSDARNLYSLGNKSQAALFSRGQGNIIYLGYDWYYGAGFAGNWASILDRAVRQRDPITSAAPQISQHPVSVSAFTDGTAIFSVRAFGAAPITFQWTFNDSPIPNANSASLVLNGLTQEDVGTYRVTVSNPLGSVESLPANLTLLEAPDRFRIVSLGTNNLRAVGHADLTGDDRGGIGLSSSHVFYQGDNSLGRFSAVDLTGGARIESRREAMVTDLATETLYTLANNNQPLNGYGLVTDLIQLDPATGATTANRVTLTTPVNLNGAFDSPGIFSGFGYAILHTGNHAYAVQFATGQVLDLGAAAPLNHSYTESWAYWGVAEFFDGTFHLVNFIYNGVVRTRVPDGQIEYLAQTGLNLWDIGDAASLVVSPTRGKWYFHTEYFSFANIFDEAMVMADAQFEFSLGPVFGTTIPPRAMSEDGVYPATDFTVVDDTTPGDQLVFTVISTNAAVIPPENVIITGTGPTFTFTLTPAPNVSGNTFITLVATDEDGNSGQTTFAVAVRPVNDAPTFTLGTNLVVLDNAGPLSFPAWATDISPGPPDEANQTLTVLISNTVSNLFLAQPTLATDGTLSFTPAPGLSGEAIVTVRLRDSGNALFGGRNLSDPQNFTITVQIANQPPIATPATFVTHEDQPLSGQLAGEDPDGDALTFELLNPPAAGLLQFQPDGTFNYLPPPDEFGMVSFTFAVHDGLVGSDPATVTLSVEPVNDAPSFTGGEPVVVLEDADPQTIPNWASNLSPGSANETGQTLSFAVTADNPGLFSAGPALSPDGTLTFTPAANWSGSTTLMVVLRDDGGIERGGVDASAPQTVTVTIDPVNDAPRFTAGAPVTVDEDAGPQSLSGWATQISAGPDLESGQILTFDITADNPGLFSAGPALSSDGTLTFTPAANWSGSTTLTVVLRDDGGTERGGVDASASQTVTVTIDPVNDAPRFTAGAPVTVDEDAGPQALPGWATQISAGPDLESGQVLSFMVTADNPGLFSAGPSLSPTGTLLFTTAPNAFGSATITIVLHDDGGTERGGVDTSAAQAVVLTIQPVNDPPTAEAQSLHTDEDTDLTLILSGQDIDGDVLSVEIVEGPGHGVLNGLRSPGLWSYSPDSNFHGADQVTYRVSDGKASSAAAVVTITVGAVNDAPVAVIQVEPAVQLSPQQTGILLLAGDGQQAVAQLDASQSSDMEEDPLTFLWLESGDLEPFAEGIQVEQPFPVGRHEVVLLADDGQAVGSATVIFEVITPGDALELLVAQVGEAPLPRNRVQPLVASLKTAIASFERDSYGSGCNQLEAFLSKVRAQVAPDHPDLAAEWNRIVHLILDAVKESGER